MSTTIATTSRDQAPSLTGMRKAAILCMTLGKEPAAEILKLLSPTEVEELSREIAVTKTVGSEIVHAVLSEFRGVFQAAEAAARGGIGVAHEILERALGPQRARVILEKDPGADCRHRAQAPQEGHARTAHQRPPRRASPNHCADLGAPRFPSVVQRHCRDGDRTGRRRVVPSGPNGQDRA